MGNPLDQPGVTVALPGHWTTLQSSSQQLQCLQRLAQACPPQPLRAGSRESRDAAVWCSCSPGSVKVVSLICNIAIFQCWKYNSPHPKVDLSDQKSDGVAL